MVMIPELLRNSSIHVFLEMHIEANFRYEGIIELRQYKLAKRRTLKIVFRLIDRGPGESIGEMKPADLTEETEKRRHKKSNRSRVYRKGYFNYGEVVV